MSAGKGDAPRPINLMAYHENYDAIFRSKLPSRRYICDGCGEKWRRNNKPESRISPPICPSCINDICAYRMIEESIPRIKKLIEKYPDAPYFNHNKNEHGQH